MALNFKVKVNFAATYFTDLHLFNGVEPRDKPWRNILLHPEYTYKIVRIPLLFINLFIYLKSHLLHKVISDYYITSRYNNKKCDKQDMLVKTVYNLINYSIITTAKTILLSINFNRLSAKRRKSSTLGFCRCTSLRE